jgi:hypothetical protein
MPSGGKSARDSCHRIQNRSWSALRCIEVCQRGIFPEKLKIYTMDGWKYCAQNERDMMVIALRRYKHPSGGANRHSDVPRTVNINAEFTLS